MARPGGGLLRLDDICAKLQSSRTEGTNEETIPEEACGKISPKYSSNEASDLSSADCVASVISGDINSNGLKDTVERLIPGGQTDLLKSCAAPEHIVELDLPCGQRDLASSNSSSASSTALREAAKISAGPSGTTGSPSGRKNRRKNAAPKNLFQMREAENEVSLLKDTYGGADEAEEYRVNNPDVDFSIAAISDDVNQTEYSQQDMNTDVVLDLSGPKASSHTDSLANNSSLESSYNTDDCGALDLSTGANVSRKKLQFTGPSPSSSEASARPLPPKKSQEVVARCANRKPSPRPAPFQHRPQQIMHGGAEGTLATARPGANPEHMRTDMKDYAESTVNELLNMYGWGENAQPVTQDVPLKNFDTGNILKWNDSGTIKKTLQGPTKKKEVGLRRGPEGIRKLKEADKEDASTSVLNPTFPYTDAEDSDKVHSSKIGALYSPLKDSNFPDYGKYVTRYNSYDHCKQAECREAQLREHFHCRECPTKVFLKKDEMIRHFKWHRKRDESLQHGFMRYSPLDDCSKRFIDCTHNGRQTHYHCIQAGCNKVYISTSDVQMHANYHRKNSTIMQLGFQRFRATEDCGNQACPFYGQRTTHFHCRRPECTFTFKNKADIEKHKTFHQKDDILAKDGFKKFMKYDSCFYPGCRYSKVSNHIHCIRAGCDYVLHSTSQLLSHKRKHERREIEFAYRKYKSNNFSKDRSAILNPALAQYNTQSTQPVGLVPNPAKDESSDTSLMDYLTNARPRQVGEFDQKVDDSESTSSAVTEDRVDEEDTTHGDENVTPCGDDSAAYGHDVTQHTDDSFQRDDEMMKSEPEDDDDDSLALSGDLLSQTHPGALSMGTRMNANTGLSASLNIPLPDQLLEAHTKLTNDVEKEANGARADSPQMGKSPAGFVPKTSPPVNEKKERDETWKRFLTRYTANDPCHSRCQFLYKDHYHCNSPTCGMLFRSKDGVRDHARHHEQLDRITELSYMAYASDAPCVDTCQYYKQEKHYHCLWTGCQEVIPESGNVFQRLEHYHTHEYARSNGRKPSMAFMQKESNLKRRRGRPPKFPKHEIPVVPKIEMDEQTIRAQVGMYGTSDPIAFGYKKFEAHEPCADDKCVYHLKEHYHCVRQRCHHATDNRDVLNLHAKDFHNFVIIQEGFEFFDRNVNCRRPHCHNNKVNRHFHCVRPKCDYSFVRYSTMSQHNKKHVMAEMGLTISPGVAIPNASLQNGEANKSVVSKSALVQSNVLRGADGLPILLPNPAQSIVTSPEAHYPANTVSGSAIVSAMSFTSVPLPQYSVPSPLQAPVGSHGISPTTTVAPIVIQPIDDPLPMVTPPGSSPLKMTIPLLPKPAEVTQTNLPLASLLQQKGSNVTPQLNWTQMLMKMHYRVNTNCGRPFCKLKKKDHYHCFDCNQAFCDPIRLKNHAAKHGVVLDKSNNISGRFLPRMTVPKIATPQTAPDHPQLNNSFGLAQKENASSQSESESELDDDPESSSLNLNPMEFTNMLQKSQKENFELEKETGEQITAEQLDASAMNKAENFMGEKEDDDEERPLEIDENATSEETLEEISLGSHGDTSSVRRSGRKRSISRHFDFTEASGSDAVGIETKRHRSHASSPKAAVRTRRQPSNTDIPDGFGRYTSSNDCAVERCTYRLNLTHYHCCRSDCIFGTADRNRLLQHTERHRKTDEVLGNEFRQFKLSQDCDRPDCEHSGKSTHYHCLKCLFICLELSKVQAHRKHHQKQEAISAQGFLKVMASETCSHSQCSYSGRQTHYHCTQSDGKCSFIAHGQQMISNHNKAVHSA